MLAQLEPTAGQRLAWFAVSHEHPDHRHVHAVVIAGRHLDGSHFRAMREVGDASAREQQRQLQPRRQPARALAPDRARVAAQRRTPVREVGR
jgi:LmbE family N-acetylglucosaminyl deacetylase